MINPGQLNRRLALEAPVETPDGAGGVTRSYVTVATLWAAVEPAGAREGVFAERLGATVTHRIVLRFSADITLAHRLRDGARVYRIVTVRERARRWLEIEAEERTD
jgi:SPP1 family predicted phage head-tail adaptor